jgi:hypothetical protein
MTLANLRKIVRAICPAAKIQTVDNTVLDLFINMGANDIAAYTGCVGNDKKFNAVAEIGEYDLITELGDFLTPDSEGLWWNNGDKWIQLNPRTLKWLDENRPNWRDLPSGTPQDYSIDGTTLTVVPKPDTALTDGFWLYYGAKPPQMTEEGHYPFSGSSTEYPDLSIFDLAICYFARMMISPIINDKTNENISLQEYNKERNEKNSLLGLRPDVSASRNNIFRGQRPR